MNNTTCQQHPKATSATLDRSTHFSGSAAVGAKSFRFAGAGWEVACWLAGALLIALYFGARSYGEVERRHAVTTFSLPPVATVAAKATTLGKVASAGLVDRSQAWSRSPDQTLWSAGRVQAYEADTITAAPSRPLAVLRIERIGLAVPVYADASERNLNRGAGLIPGTATPGSAGNIAIAAHRDGYFRALQNVVVGDLVELQSQARHQQYRISEISIVEPTDISPLYATEVDSVTLVTCYPFHFVGSAPRRYIVRAMVAVDSVVQAAKS